MTPSLAPSTQVAYHRQIEAERDDAVRSVCACFEQVYIASVEHNKQVWV